MADELPGVPAVGQDKPTPSFVELLGAGLLRESVPARLLWEWDARQDFPADPGYDPLKDERLKDIGSGIAAFAFSRSPDETTHLLERRAEDLHRQEMLEEQGWRGAAASMLGAVINPSVGIPVLALGGRAFRSGLMTGGAFGAATGLEQSYLASVDSTRSPEEVALNTALSGAVGLGVGAIASRYHAGMRHWRSTMDRFEGEAPKAEPPPPRSEPSAPRSEPSAPGPLEIDPETGAARAAQPQSTVFTRPGEADDLERLQREAEARFADDVHSAGARGAFDIRTDQQVADDLSPKSAFGLEKLSVNPTLGLLNSDLGASRELVETLVEIPFFLRQDAKGIARAPSIESAMRQYRVGLSDTLRLATNNWLVLRTGKGGEVADQLKLQASDLLKRTAGMGYDEFMERVGRAMRRGDDDAVPEIAATAKAFRKVLDHLGREAAETGAFEQVQTIRREIVRLRESLGDLADLPTPKGEAADGMGADTLKLREQLDDALARLAKVEGKVPEQKTAASFFPRVWKHDEILRSRSDLEQVLADWFRKTNPNGAGQAMERAKETVTRLLHDEPFQHLDDPGVTGAAMSLHGRTLDIPDELVERWLESNAEAVLRHHVRTTSADIEIVRHQNLRWSDFGHEMGLISMYQDRKAIGDAWMEKIREAAGDAPLRESRAKAKDADLERIVGLRDRLRGAVGLTRDPWSTSARAIRVAKQTASILYMGGAALTATIDIMRPVMTEGFKRTLEHGYRPLFMQSRPLIMQMARREAQLAGTAMDLTMGLRGALLLDSGDTFGRYSRLEGAISKMADLTFVANGLSWVDENVRTVASMVVGTRILDDSLKLARGTLDDAGIETLARAGIDQPMAMRIARLYGLHGEAVDGVKIANTAKWVKGPDADPLAAEAFRRALGEDIDRTIPLVGKGDTPLFMSRPLGSLLMMFRSFGFAGLMRTTIPALQQRDRSAFVGMALMAGMAGLVNEIRDHLNGVQKERSFAEKMRRAVDRSGVAGIVGDVVNAAERIGDRGLPGVVEQAGGPAASIGLDTGKVLIDLANRTMTDPGARAARRLLPWNTMVWADSLFDAVEGGIKGSRGVHGPKVGQGAHIAEPEGKL